jgi:hypothetical protein
VKKITKIQPLDGKIHDNTKEAKKHLDVLLGNLLNKHCHKVNGKPYMEITEHLFDPATIKDFAEAYQILQDAELIGDDDENDD